jgi:transposase
MPPMLAAICEAVTRPSMRFVPIKTAEQQAALTVHRTRDLLIGQRTQFTDDHEQRWNLPSAGACGCRLKGSAMGV